MSTIGGLSSSTSTSALRGYGGLASGLDRDTLIEQLTAGTQAKIDKKNQAKTSLQWEQEAIRAITDKIYDFTNKYASYSSSDNLLGSSLFSRTDISVNGANGKYISVSGSTQTSDLLTVLGVKQLAQKASATSNNNASDGKLTMGSISDDLSAKTDVNMVGGEKIYIKYGNTSYTIELGRGTDEDGNKYEYDTPEQIAESFNKALGEVSIGNDKTLADVMSMEADGGKLKLTNKDAAGNNLELTGGTGDVLVNLGFLNKGEDISKLDDNRKVIETGKSLTAVNEDTAVQKKTIKEQLAGQSISFSYNGTVKWIELPSEAEMKDWTSMEDVKEYLQKELDDTFGRGRIAVDLEPKDPKQPDGIQVLSFRTTLPDGSEDNSSVLSITASTGHLTGEDSLFGMKDGESNRLNLSASLKDAGLKHEFHPDSTGKKPLLKINDKVIEGIDENSTIQEIINAVNNSDAGVIMSYQENTDRFVITAVQNGASGQVEIEGTVAEALFGTKKEGEPDITVTAGKDAVIAVQYAGSNTVTEITRDSNTITVDGLNITVNGTFGYDEEGNRIEETEAVTFTAKADIEKTAETVKQMIEDFNELLKLVNDEVSTKPNRDYAPLTASQKKELSENEIEVWEKEAKKGLLFNDTDIRGLTDALRFAIPDNLRAGLEEIGITVSTNYADNGKLTFDESKFKAALEANPEKVRELFSASAGTDEDGNPIKGGLMTNMKTIMDKYASMTGATKGILVERAGSEHSLTSVLNNSILDQINEIEDQIERLTTQLVTEQDRYISQFTSLETLISQMNSQSSWLAQMMGS